MFCIILKHSSWEPEIGVILSVIVLFVYYITYIDVGIEATACAHSSDTIRYDTIRHLVVPCNFAPFRRLRVVGCALLDRKC